MGEIKIMEDSKIQPIAKRPANRLYLNTVLHSDRLKGLEADGFAALSGCLAVSFWVAGAGDRDSAGEPVGDCVDVGLGAGLGDRDDSEPWGADWGIVVLGAIVGASAAGFAVPRGVAGTGVPKTR